MHAQKCVHVSVSTYGDRPAETKLSQEIVTLSDEGCSMVPRGLMGKRDMAFLLCRWVLL